jgi:hypothetical protein
MKRHEVSQTPLGHQGGASQPEGAEAILLAQAHRRRGLDLALGQRREDRAGVQPALGSGLSANVTSHIARAEAGPGAAEERGAGAGRPGLAGRRSCSCRSE